MQISRMALNYNILCICLYFKGEIPLWFLKNLERLADVAKFKYAASSAIDISE